MSVAAVPGFICAYEFGADGSASKLSEDRSAATLKGGGDWIWLHLNLADWRCRRWLGDVLDLSRTIVEEFANPPVRQNVSCRGGVLYGHIADFRREFDADSTEFAWLHVVQGTRFLITGRVKAVQSAERARQFIDPAATLPHLTQCSRGCLRAMQTTSMQHSIASLMNSNSSRIMCWMTAIAASGGG